MESDERVQSIASGHPKALLSGGQQHIMAIVDRVQSIIFDSEGSMQCQTNMDDFEKVQDT